MGSAKGGTIAKAQTLNKGVIKTATPTMSVPSVAPTSAATANTLGTTITNAGSAIQGTIDNFLSSYMDYANQGAAMANAESRAAQERQFAFNSAEAAKERAYNKEMWEANASFNSAEAELNRAFNAKEAQTNRDWQERMANNAYQREVADLKAAGLNPVLAALNSGAATGSGAQASGSSASSSYGGGSTATGSNYTGQGHNMSEALAMIGAIGSMIGAGASAFGSWLNNQSNYDFGILSAGTSKGSQGFLQKIFGGNVGKGQNTGHRYYNNRRPQ